MIKAVLFAFRRVTVSYYIKKQYVHFRSTMKRVISVHTIYIYKSRISESY